MSGQVGASISSLAGVTRSAGSTAELSLHTSQETARQGQRVRTEIQEAADAFTAEFDDIGSRMQSQVDATNNNVQALAATGMSPEQARAATADFTRLLAEVQATAGSAVADFKARSITRSDEINEVIGTQLKSVLTGFEAEIASFGTAVNGFGNRLTDIDNNAIKYV